MTENKLLSVKRIMRISGQKRLNKYKWQINTGEKCLILFTTRKAQVCIKIPFTPLKMAPTFKKLDLVGCFKKTQKSRGVGKVKDIGGVGGRVEVNMIKSHCMKFSNFIFIKGQPFARIINFKCNKYVLKNKCWLECR